LLILNAFIIALSFTYAKLTNVDRFWDVLSEHINGIEPQHTAGRGELYQAFISSNFEALIDKQQEELCKKLHLRDDIVLTKSMIESLSSICMSILFKRPLLLVGHSGISKSLALSLVEQALMSVIIKDELGLPRDHQYRIIKLDASTGITEDDFEYIIGKAERRQKKYSKLHYTIALDGFNLEHKTHDNLHILNLIQKMVKMTEVSAIAISSNETLKLDAS
jgi:hypothetical protein